MTTQLWQSGTNQYYRKLASSLGVSGQTIVRYVDLLTDLLLVRRLSPWHGNIKKRLVKSPKVYLRDSGVLHAEGSEAYFYRTERGFHEACKDIKPTHRFVVYNGQEKYPIKDNVCAINLADLMAELIDS